MRILVTGARGFIGKNMVVRLGELPGYEVIRFDRGDNVETLPSLLTNVDAVIHLAGENRPKDVNNYFKNNALLTETLCQAIFNSKRQIPLILASSIQADLDNPYGQSKRKAEIAAEHLADSGNPTIIYRLPGVFGKWCKPNYNSVVATFCHNIANDLPIEINNASTRVRLVYIDDVVSSMIASLQAPETGLTQASVKPEYLVTLGELARQIQAFPECRESLMTERVGAGLSRALYATYVTYLPKEKFSYDVPEYKDSRGLFVEMLKTPDSGQFSFFTAHPGKTRGGHYHHTKTEKFLVIKGEALFRFRHLITDELHELRTSGDKPCIVDTIPGWSHDITNVGNEEMLVMLWANEVLDRDNPDTVLSKL
ncbi:MAG: capsular biosynthesis protein [Thalassospira sp. Nap_22]|nr:MAG: capsular biosynthesis protein [Thalassospira sp. Nap_22]